LSSSRYSLLKIFLIAKILRSYYTKNAAVKKYGRMKKGLWI
jgi:hypothetical protein